MLKIASEHFPELNALNFFSVTVKGTGLPDSQREINLVIFLTVCSCHVTYAFSE